MCTDKLFERICYIGTLPIIDIEGITTDSRRVKEGWIFVCVKGLTSDGHNFAQKAYDQGASVIVSERELGFDNEVVVKNTREAYALLCSAYFDNPADKLKVIAVTGTNGKTTATTIIKQILERSGERCGLIGTVHVEIDKMHIPAKYTTPEPWDLHALLARMVSAKCTCVIMEASSHALHQLRLFGVNFTCAAFTNLTQDHLDYHGTMEEYFKAKEMLFDNCDTMVLNIDDEYANRILKDFPNKKAITFSTTKKDATLTAKNEKFSANGVKFTLVGDGFEEKVDFPMPGDYSVHNALTAAGCAIACGVEPKIVAEGLTSSIGVKGRCEVLYHGDFTIIADYAHTGDGIEKMLSGIAPFVKGRLIALFGCAGERDTEKFPAMSIAAGTYADIVILTSDNPRGDNPEVIISIAEPALKKCAKEYIVKVERRDAVNTALDMLQLDDVLVLCGKGHEDYQVLDGVTIYLDEHRIVKDWLVDKGLVK